MKTKNTKQLITLMQGHFDNDRIVGGAYDHGNGTFCNIGCLAKGKNDVLFIQTEYNIPVAVMKIQENIFEALPSEEQSQFALDCAKAIGVDGKDLSLIMPKMMVAILSRLLKANVVTTVIDLYNRVIAGEDMNGLHSEFINAANAAAYAAANAVDAAHAAANAANAATAAANAANAATAYAPRATAYAARAAVDAARAAYAPYAADAAHATYAAANAAANAVYAARAAYAPHATYAAANAERQLQKKDLLRILTTAPVETAQ